MSGDSALDVAIIGLSGRFPGADSVRELWSTLLAGSESIRRFTAPELVAMGADPEAVAAEGFVPAAGVVSDIKSFDAAFFGVSPREAELTDPQHRLFLESAWAALEDAGFLPERSTDTVGVFAGCGPPSYLVLNLMPHAHLTAPENLLAVMNGNDKDSLATRVAYKLGLHGPALTVQTACSTSLVAVHLACQHLIGGQCDLALAGGVSLTMPAHTGYTWQKGGIGSADGHCRAFDAGADGTVFSSGVGVVVLQRLDDALAQGSHVYAVIRGSAVNNDGARKIGFTAPSIEGQAEVVAMAHTMADVSPRSIAYVEAHGTGTPIGDAAELRGLCRAFASGSADRQYCGIGSLKTNLGHLDTAAGVAGLIKAAMALEQGVVPASLHFATANPEIPFETTPFFVDRVQRPWPRTAGAPRRAGVSAFGIGGTNAHVVLEEAPERPPSEGTGPWLLPLSARTPTALAAVAERLASHLDAAPDVALVDVAHTLRVGRRTFPCRAAVVCTDRAEASRALRTMVTSPHLDEAGRGAVFLFPGQGGPQDGAARALYRDLPAFRDAVDHCARLLRPHLGPDVRDLLFSDPAGRTDLAQPAGFVLQYALSRVWSSWGLEPAAVVGHSVGEYVAATLAGVFSLADALRLVTVRGRLMQGTAPGRMLGVAASPAALARFVDGEIEIAVFNAADQCVLAGPPDAIEALRHTLAGERIASRLLPVEHAFHSRRMEPILAAFEHEVAQVERSAPTLPLASNVSGTWMTAAEAVSPRFWADQIRSAVRFAENLACVAQTPSRLFVEVGPGQVLGRLVRTAVAAAVVVPSLPSMFGALGRVWACGVDVDLGSPGGQRISLPTYPFERQEHWVDPPGVRTAPLVPPERGSSPRGRAAAPAETIEAQLADIWQELLGVGSFRPHDDFLDLGGDSLVAARVLVRIRERFGIDLPAGTLFDRRTLAGLAAAVREHVPNPEPSLVPSDDAGPTELSFGQGRLWFLDRWTPGDTTYNELVHLHLAGRLDPEALQDALATVVDRHAVLRTVFHDSPDGPRQTVDPHARPPLHRHDLSSLTPDERENQRAAWVEHERTTPFDLTTGPVLRARLLRLADDDHELLFSIHHIACDGWSFGILVRELCAAYTARVRGEDPALSPLPAQYADFARWQRAAARSPRALDSLAWWKEQLSPPAPRFDVPFARPVPEVPTSRGLTAFFTIGADTAAGILRLAREEDVSPFMVFLAAFQAVLHRWSGTPDVRVGSPVAGRSRTEIEPLIGFFVNTVVYRCDLSGDPTFRDHLRRVRATCLAVASHSDVPFEHLVDVLRDPAPLFEVLFALQNTPAATFDLPDLRVSPRTVDRGTAKFPLSLSLTASTDGWDGELECSADRFDAADGARMVAQFGTLLNGAVRSPDHAVSALPLGTVQVDPRRYWERQLDGAPERIDLPCLQGPPERVTVTWDPTVFPAFTALAARSGATPFATLLAAFAVLLSRTSGQTDLVIGVAAPLAEPGATLGLRLDLSGEPDFLEVLRRVSETCLGAGRHRTLRPTGNPHVLFALEEPADPRSEWVVVVEPSGVTGIGRADRAAVERVLGHLEVLLQAIVAAPETPIGRYPLMRPDERALVTGTFCGTADPGPFVAVHLRVAAQAARIPDAVAVVHGVERTSYRELDQRAEQLAYHLRARGVGPEVRVAIALGRTVEMVIAILAVWKAGGAWVPIDPRVPAARVLRMLDVASAPVLVTEARLTEAAWVGAADVVCVDRDREQIAAAVRTELPQVDADTLSHVIFTSGSTGAPNAVAIRHRSVSARLRWARDRFDDGELSGVLASTSLSFDLSVFELWAPLAWGGAAILAESVLTWPELPARDEVRLINTVPSAMAELVRGNDLRGVRTVNLAGEALPRALVTLLHDLPTVTRVYNLYGPSEDTTYSTEERVSADERGPPTIGRPLPGTRARILDGHHEPVPIGVTGELYLSGEGLAREYLGRPDLTADRFVTGATGERMYRTGDLARWRIDGRIEYLGRRDHQVKLRGFRIELGDVEAALRALGMRDTVVVARPIRGEPALVAYAVPATRPWPTPDQVRRSLAERLPEPLVPAVVMLVEALPRSINGKLDRAALPEPQASVSAGVAPRDPLEHRLVTLWEDLLGVGPIGVTDDFFALGGNSLRILGLAAAIEQRFSRRLPIAALVGARTVARVALLLRDGPVTESPALVLRPTGPGRTLFCVHPASGSALVYRPLADRLGPHGLVGLQADDAVVSVPEMAARYVAAIRAIQPEGPYALAGWSLGGVVAWEIAVQLRAVEQNVDVLVLLDSWAPAAGLGDRDEGTLFVELAREYGLDGTEDEIRASDRSVFVGRLAAVARRGQHLPDGAAEREIERVIRTWTTNVQAVDRYHPPSLPAHACGIVFGVAAQTASTFDDAIQTALGWHTNCQGPPEVRVIPGSHRSLVTEPDLGPVAALLVEALSRSSKDSPGIEHERSAG